MKTFSPDKQSHIPVLDGIRGMAILMVLLFHFWMNLSVYNYHFSPIATRLLSLLFIGQKGVDLFFVLSGFLITGILLHTKGSPHYFKNFYIRRALRIFPLYFVVIIGCLLAGAIWHLPEYQWKNTWWYLCYLQNVGKTFWPGHVQGPAHFWSLAVEEHFYLFWPFMVLALSKRKLVFFSLSLVAVSVVMRIIFLLLGVDVFTFTLCRMDALAIGALLAILFTDSLHWDLVVQHVRRWVLPLAAISFASFFIFSGAGNPVVQTLKYTLFAILCGFIIVLSLSPGPWNPLPAFFQMNQLRTIGKISYGMYVFHPFIYEQVLGRFYSAPWSPVHGRLWPSIIVELTLAAGLTVLISWASWKFFEYHFNRLKSNFRYQEQMKESKIHADRLQPVA